MNHPGDVDVPALERDVSAALDQDLATAAAQTQDFQQRVYAMNAAWQPVPPQMFADFADGMTRWIEYFRGYGPAAERLAAAGRPAFGQRLNAVIADFEQAVPIYRQMAGQQASHLMGMARTMADSNREATRIMTEANAASQAAFARQNEAFSKYLRS